MLEGYVKAITTDAKFNDDMTNMQSIMSSSGYNRTVEAALNMTEELITSIFDASYRGVKMTLDEPPIEGQEGDPVDITGSVPKEIIDAFWETCSQPIETDIKNILLYQIHSYINGYKSADTHILLSLSFPLSDH